MFTNKRILHTTRDRSSRRNGENDRTFERPEIIRIEFVEPAVFYPQKKRYILKTPYVYLSEVFQKDIIPQKGNLNFIHIYSYCPSRTTFVVQ